MMPENNQPQPNDPRGVEVHQAGTVITPNTPSPSDTVAPPTPPTPQPPAPEPAAAPAPVPAPSPPAAPQPSIQPLTQADFLAIAKKDKQPKRLAILIGAPIAIILLLALLHITGIFPLTVFKTVKYDNGQDSIYSLSFYSRYKVEDATSDEKDLSGASKVLVSKKGKAGQSPIKLYIQDTEVGGGSSGFSNSLKSCGQTESVFTAYNKASQEDVSVCDFGSIVGVDDALYMAAFEQNDHLIAVLIASEALNDTKSLDNAAEAKKVLEKAKIDVYEDDIKKIIGSIKLVSD